MPGRIGGLAWRLYAGLVLERPWLVLLALAGLAALAGMQLGAVKFDVSSDTLVLEEDADLQHARDIAKRYGAQPFMLAVWRPRDGDLLAPENLAHLDALSQRLAGVEGVASTLSILDAPLLVSAGVSLADLGRGKLPTLRASLPGASTPALAVDRDRALAEFLSSPIYKDLLVSADGRSSAILINLAPDARYEALHARREQLRALRGERELSANEAVSLRETQASFRAHVDWMTQRNSALVSEVRSVIDAFRGGGDVLLGGVPMIVADIIDFVKHDLSVFGWAILALMTAALAVVFRGAWRWTALPLLNCALTAVCVIGLFAWLDWRFSVMSANFFALLLIMTLSVSVHLVVRYRELHAAATWKPPSELAAETARFMMRPCLFMTLTTLVAFVSLVVSGIRPVIDFGQMMAIGVSVALVFAFVLLPAMMCVLPKEAESNLAPPERAATRWLAWLADRRRTPVFAVSAALALFSLGGIAQLEVENRFIDYFDERTEIYRGMERIDRDLGGTIPLDIILRAPAAGEPAADALAGEDDAFDDFDDGALATSVWFNRAGLERIGAVHDYLDGLEETGKVLSLATAQRVVNAVLGEGEEASDVELAVVQHGLPKALSSILVDPYLSDADGEARLSIRVKETSRTLRRDAWLKQVRSHLVDQLGFAPEQVRLSGLLVLYNNMMQSLYSAQIQTLGAVFLVILLMLIALFRSWRVALVGIVPNILAAGSVLGVMGWFGIPLDMMTTMTAAIVVGIGVDNTIHYLYRFRHELSHGADDDYVQAMYRSHGSIGRAMHYTSATVALGLLVLTLSNFNPSVLFGALTAMAMLLALLGALLLLPPMLFVFRPFGNPSVARSIDSLALPKRR